MLVKSNMITQAVAQATVENGGNPGSNPGRGIRVQWHFHGVFRCCGELLYTMLFFLTVFLIANDVIKRVIIMKDISKKLFPILIE